VRVDHPPEEEKEEEEAGRKDQSGWKRPYLKARSRVMPYLAQQARRPSLPSTMATRRS
jgi:hypothetical protein